MESSLDLTYPQCLVEAVSGPALIISKDGKVLAANAGITRLTGQHVYSDKSRPNSILGKAIEDLGWALIPITKPVYREWSMLLSALQQRAADVANRPSAPSTPQPTSRASNQSPRRKHKDLVATNEFWDEEERRNVSEEMDVFINFMTDSQRIVSSTRCRMQISMCMIGLQKTKVFLIKLRRPPAQDLGANVPAIAQEDDAIASAILKPPWTPDSLVHEGLVEKHDDLSTIIDQLLPHVLGILDQNGEVEYLSPSWYLYTALTEAQSLRSEWCQAIHPDDMCKMLSAWADTIGNKLDHWTWEARFRRFE